MVAMNTRILILESIGGQTAAQLQHSGCACVLNSCTQPDELLRQVADFAPDLVLSTYPFNEVAHLLTLLTTLRRQYPAIPFVLLIGSQAQMVYLEALNHGASGYVLQENLAQLPALADRLLQAVVSQKRMERLLQARLFLSEISIRCSMDELLQTTLDEAEKLTDSLIGFFHFVEADQKNLWLQTWSTNTLRHMCTAEGKGAHYSLDKAGVWVDCVRERRPIIHNDYMTLSHRKGLPKGHAKITRELVVPVVQGQLIVAVLGVGNKPSDYTDQDTEVVVHLADMAWDIVKRKRTEQALYESQQRLHSAHLLKTFIQNTAHEFRTPLAVITTNAYLMSRIADHETRQQKEGQIRTNVERITRLVDMLLLMTKVESGDMTISNCIDINKTLQEACACLDGDHVMRYDMQPDLPPVWGNADYLVDALRQILDNACRYTPIGGAITVKTGVDGAWVWIEVHDTGIGIPDALHPYVFDAFWRQDEAHSTPGLGLGLPIAQKIIEKHGGAITFESQPGQGSVFRVSLPIAPDPVA